MKIAITADAHFTSYDEEKIELTSKDMPIPEAMAIEFTSFVVDYI